MDGLEWKTLLFFGGVIDHQRCFIVKDVSDFLKGARKADDVLFVQLLNVVYC